MTKAAIYARYSSTLQTEASIDAQLAACRAFCASRGFEVIVEFVDRAESASTTKRPQFQAMLTDMRSRRFEVIVTHKLDRLSRNLADVLLMMKEFKEHECRYVSATEQLDLTTPFGMMILVILAWFAEWYLINLRGEIAKGKRVRASKGISNASILPFGYSRNELKIPRPDDNAVHVRWAFQQYASGLVSYLEIAAEFNRLGLITKRGGRWNVDNVREMIQNPYYAGWVTERGVMDARTNGGKGDTLRRVPRSQRKLHRGTHEPIISQELYDQCSDVRATRWSTTRGRRPKRVEMYLLGGIAYCSHCGRKLRAGSREGGKYKNYLCTSHRLNTPCAAERRYVPETALAAQVEAKIAQLAMPERYEASALQQLNARQARKDYDKRIKALESERRRLSLMFQKGLIEEAYLDSETARISSEIKALQKPVDVPASIEHLHRIVELWNEADDLEKAQIVHAIFERIEVDTDAQRIVHWDGKPEFAGLLSAKPRRVVSNVVTTGVAPPIDSKVFPRK